MKPEPNPLEIMSKKWERQQEENRKARIFYLEFEASQNKAKVIKMETSKQKLA